MFSKKLRFIKVILLFTIIFFSTFNIFAEFYFSGETGIQSTFIKSTSTNDLGMEIQGYLSGQFSLSNNMFLRSEIAVKTADILENGIFKDSKAAFCLNEISFNYAIPTYNKTQFFSFFTGNTDPIGTDRFLKHQFGLSNVTSPLFESYVGADGIYIYQLYGIGGSYIVRFSAVPISLGFYIYKNNENDDDDNQPNFDFRIATASKYFVMDFAFGAGIPFSKQDSQGNDVFLEISKIYLHSGLTMLIGNSSSTNLFLQTGFRNIEFSSISSLMNLKPENLYILFEPRFKSTNLNLNISIFNIPENHLFEIVDITDPLSIIYKKYLFVEDSLGCNFMFYTDKLSFSNKDLILGTNFTFAFSNCYLNDLSNLKDVFEDSKKFKISPFANMEIMGGELGLSFQLNVLDIVKHPSESICLTTSYKKTL